MPNNKCILCDGQLEVSIRIAMDNKTENITYSCPNCKYFNYTLNYNMDVYWFAQYNNYSLSSMKIYNISRLDCFNAENNSINATATINNYLPIPKSKDELTNIINSILLYK